jgi:membrane-bound metal-dependent hydrolase YbcI (DUF457 family)
VVNARSLSLNLLAGCFMAALAGSLFPDVDTKSMGQLIFYRVGGAAAACGALLGKWIFCSVLLLLMAFPLTLRHRGLTHDPRFIILLFLFLPSAFTLLPYIPKAPAWALSGYFAAGAFSHLLLDLGIKRVIKKLFTMHSF